MGNRARGRKKAPSRNVREDSPESKPQDATERGLSDSPTDRKIILGIILLCCLTYANSLGGDFLYDDIEVILNNPQIRSWQNIALGFKSHVWAFREQTDSFNVPPPLPYYRPIFGALITTEYKLFGIDRTQGWHLVSLLIHTLCAIGVYFVLTTLSARKEVAALAAALFSVFPAHAESVSWICGVTDPLYSLFLLASLWLYLKHHRREKAWGLTGNALMGVSMAAFALSLLSKETGAALIPIVFGYAVISSTGS